MKHQGNKKYQAWVRFLTGIFFFIFMGQTFSLIYWFRRSRSIIGLAKEKKTIKEKKSWRNLQKAYECNSVLIFFWHAYNMQVMLHIMSVQHWNNGYQGSHFQRDLTLGGKRKGVALLCRHVWNWFPLPTCLQNVFLCI